MPIGAVSNRGPVFQHVSSIPKLLQSPVHGTDLRTSSDKDTLNSWPACLHFQMATAILAAECGHTGFQSLKQTQVKRRRCNPKMVMSRP